MCRIFISLVFLIFASNGSFADYQQVDARKCAVQAPTRMLADASVEICWQDKQRSADFDDLTLSKGSNFLISSMQASGNNKYFPFSNGKSFFEKQIKYMRYINENFVSVVADPTLNVIAISDPYTKVRPYKVDLKDGWSCYGFTRGLGGRAGQLDGNSSQGVTQIVTAIACTLGEVKGVIPILESVEVKLRR